MRAAARKPNANDATDEERERVANPRAQARRSWEDWDGAEVERELARWPGHAALLQNPDPEPEPAWEVRIYFPGGGVLRLPFVGKRYAHAAVEGLAGCEAVAFMELYRRGRYKGSQDGAG